MFAFVFNDTATTEIYTLSLHDALPIWSRGGWSSVAWSPAGATQALLGTGQVPLGVDVQQLTIGRVDDRRAETEDRKSTRLNSSHANISYAVFCLKKKKTSQSLWSFHI